MVRIGIGTLFSTFKLVDVVVDDTIYHDIHNKSNKKCKQRGLSVIYNFIHTDRTMRKLCVIIKGQKSKSWI